MSDPSSELKYTVSPTQIYYTRDASGKNPSIVILTVTVTPADPTVDTVDCSYIGLKIQVGSGINDLVSTTNAGKISPQSNQPSLWKFTQGAQNDEFIAQPIAPNKGISKDNPLTLQLANIWVNDQGPGSTTLSLTDPFLGSGKYIDKEINKVASQLSIDSLNVKPPNVQAGGTTEITWSTTAAAQVTLQPQIYYKWEGNKKVYNPEINTTDTVYADVKETTTFTLFAQGQGPVVSAQKTVSVDPVKIEYFTPSSSLVNAGAKIDLSWEAINAESCSITPGNYDNLNIKDTLSDVQVWSDTTFTLTATSLAGTTQNLPKQVDVNPVKISSFTASPSSGLRAGDELTLSWNIVSANAGNIAPSVGDLSQSQLASSSTQLKPSQETTYVLTAQGKGGPLSSSVRIMPMRLGWYPYSTNNGPFSTFTNRPVLINFKDEVWAMAGGPSNVVYHSFNGNDWQIATNGAPWKQRIKATGISFNNKMWLLGGQDSNGAVLNDVWSSEDGENWTCVQASADWSARRSLGCFIIGTELYIAGGIDSTGAGLRDVWKTTDGESWTAVDSAAFPTGKAAFATAAFDGKIYILGGLNGGDENSGTVTNQVLFSTDGITWNFGRSSKWLPRYECNAEAIGHYLYLSGGLDQLGKPISDLNILDDDGNWSISAGPPWKNIITSSVNYQDAFWMVGGAEIPDQGDSVPNTSVWAYAPSLD